MRSFIFLAVFSSSVPLVVSAFGGATYSCTGFELYANNRRLAGYCKGPDGKYEISTIDIGNCMEAKNGHVFCQKK